MNAEVYNLTTDGVSTTRATEYEERMKKARSVMILWRERNNELKKEKEVFLHGNLSSKD